MKFKQPAFGTGVLWGDGVHCGDSWECGASCLFFEVK
jgi:hypothetical protein